MKKTEEVSETKEQTKSDKLWDKIKDAPIEMFALDNQTIDKWVKREAKLEVIEDGSLYLTLKAPAVLPALEEALYKVRINKNEKFDVNKVDRYTVIKIVPKIQ